MNGVPRARVVETITREEFDGYVEEMNEVLASHVACIEELQADLVTAKQEAKTYADGIGWSAFWQRCWLMAGLSYHLSKKFAGL